MFDSVWRACESHGPVNYASEPRNVARALPHACAATPMAHFAVNDTGPTAIIIQPFQARLSGVMASGAGQNERVRSGGHGASMGRAGRWHSRGAGLGGAGRSRAGMDQALNLPSGSFQEDVADSQLGPREKLIGGERAKTEFGWEAMGVSDLSPYGTECSVQASGSISPDGDI